MNAAQLKVSSQLTEKGWLVEAIGEIDLTTAPFLREPLAEATNDPAKPAVIVDLRQVDFIDSAGLALMVETRKKLAPEGRTLYVLLTSGRQPERVLKLGRFDTIIHLAYDFESLQLPAEAQE